MTYRFIRNFLFAFLFFVSHPAQAADVYFDYVADFYLHESHQARNPSPVIRYADGEKGALLQSVLDPKRVKTVLGLYLAFMKRSEHVPEVPKLLQPLSARYAEAFKNDPRAYEAEYLDSLEASVEVVAIASSMMIDSTPPAQTSKVSGPDAEKQKALMDSLQSLVKMARNLSDVANKAMAADILSKVTKGMFSENGAKRALAIADRLAPQ
ncbi:MAG: hypothetical protein PHY62_11625 [Gallionella sp.]|nr:hypothetical protein [Gallionella sp.]